jgi:hypothetical protein
MIKRFKQSQKFRIINGNACFYATAKQIRNGVGQFITFNAATQKALDALEFSRSGRGGQYAIDMSVGIAGTWEGLQIQLDIM